MKIFVGCSSQETHNLNYISAANTIGTFISTNKHTLVFGGCNKGLMGEIYNTVSADSNKIIAVVSNTYKFELQCISCEDAFTFKSTARRKQYFYNNSDVLVFLPGGPGTLDELVSAIEAKRNKEHNAHILIVNIEGYFCPLLNMYTKTYIEGFTNSKYNELFDVVYSAEDACEYLKKIDK